MLKKYLILLIMLVICYNSYGNFYNKNLKEKIITAEADFQNCTLEDLFSVLTKDSGVVFIPDSEIKNELVDIYFPTGTNMENLINTILQIYHLDISSVGEIFIISKRGKTTGQCAIYGSIVDKIFKQPVDNVKITLMNNGHTSTYSKYGGKFVIPNIDPGVYIVKFEKNGYVTKGEIINTKDKNNFSKIEIEKNNKNFENKKIESGATITQDKGIITKKIILNNNNPEEIKKVLMNNFGDQLAISSISKKSILIITGEKSIVDNALLLIHEIDKNIEQIRISSQILDVSNNLFEDLGIQWEYSHNSSNRTNTSNGISTNILKSEKIIGVGSAYSSGLGITKAFHNGADILNFQIHMLEATQDLVVSARPSILVLNGEEGEFKITEEVIAGQKKYENKNSDSKNENANDIIYTPLFKEAGIILKVIPHIKENGYIILDVLIEVSNFKLKHSKDDSHNAGTYNADGGSKIGRSIKTTIKMKDGQTVLIGGLKRATIHNSNSKVPFLGTLPMIKYFFKNETIDHEMSDIYIKLKLDIVENETTGFEKDEIHTKINEIKDKRIYKFKMKKEV